MSHIFFATQGMAERLTASRFSALKGLQMVARGKGAQRPPPRVWIDIKFAPLPAVQSRLLKTAPDGGERGGGVGLGVGQGDELAPCWIPPPVSSHPT